MDESVTIQLNRNFTILILVAYLSFAMSSADTIEARSARILQLLQTLATVSSELQKELLGDARPPQQPQAQQLQAQLQAQQLQAQQLQAQQLQAQQLAEHALFQQQYERMLQEQQVRDRVREEAAKQRLEQQRLEQQRLEQQRLEQQRLEQQRLEQQRLEQQRLEQQRLQEQEQQRLQKQQEQFEQWLDQESPLLTELQYVVQQILRGEYEKAVKSGESSQTQAMILPILRSSIPRNKAHLLPAAGGRGEFKRIVEQIPNVAKVCIKANDWGYYLTRV